MKNYCSAFIDPRDKVFDIIRENDGKIYLNGELVEDDDDPESADDED